MAYQLSKAQHSDIPWLLALRLNTMDVHLKEMGFALSQDEHLERVTYAFEHADIIHFQQSQIGMIKWRLSPTAAEVLQLQILPEQQNKGHGHELLTQLLQEHAPKPFYLSVLKANPAKDLYLRLGFNIIGEQGPEFHMKHQNNSGSD